MGIAVQNEVSKGHLKRMLLALMERFFPSFGTMDMSRWPSVSMSYFLLIIVALSLHSIYALPDMLFINLCIFAAATLKDLRLTIVQTRVE